MSFATQLSITRHRDSRMQRTAGSVSYSLRGVPLVAFAAQRLESQCAYVGTGIGTQQPYVFESRAALPCGPGCLSYNGGAGHQVLRPSPEPRRGPREPGRQCLGSRSRIGTQRLYRRINCEHGIHQLLQAREPPVSLWIQVSGRLHPQVSGARSW